MNDRQTASILLVMSASSSACNNAALSTSSMDDGRTDSTGNENSSCKDSQLGTVNGSDSMHDSEIDGSTNSFEDGPSNSMQNLTGANAGKGDDDAAGMLRLDKIAQI